MRTLILLVLLGGCGAAECDGFGNCDAWLLPDGGVEYAIPGELPDGGFDPNAGCCGPGPQLDGLQCCPGLSVAAGDAGPLCERTW